MSKTLLLIMALWALVLEPTFGIAESWEHEIGRSGQGDLPHDGPRDNPSIDQPVFPAQISIDLHPSSHQPVLFDVQLQHIVMIWGSESNSQHWSFVARMRGGGPPYPPSDRPLRI